MKQDERNQVEDEEDRGGQRRTGRTGEDRGGQRSTEEDRGGQRSFQKPPGCTYMSDLVSSGDVDTGSSMTRFSSRGRGRKWKLCSIRTEEEDEEDLRPGGYMLSSLRL
ncbi:unnamed protein product [Pleuronectes platessa]|uniref:Uncharacterized protein n=1 Tax=Pleuronectes platessa TaxID=8262 RepID=A0A9N7YSZ3_PLEPL|nr:unnamed protein product [Pleuronectes platessa]